MMETGWFAIGFVVGLVVASAVGIFLHRRALAVAKRLSDQAAADREAQQQQLIETMRREFAALSRDALSANTDDFLKLAKTRFEQQSVEAEKVLDTKKKLIDSRLEDMGTRLQRIDTVLREVDKHGAESHASLKTELHRATDATNRLHDTTAQLNAALTNPQRRGQWGERMAEDVLRLAGFIDGVNYRKQQSAVGGNRPDFTFPLPGGQKVNMDVKFPLGNYLKMLDAQDEGARNGFRAAFLKDVRQRVREVVSREYIDPASGTVDYVLVFIPNEQVYGFIHEHDAALLDDALRQKVVLCAPLTLYAILAVIRQASENFRLEQSARQVIELLADFKKQWGKYVESMDKLGRRLEDAMKDFTDLTGTRTRQLDRQLDKIDAIQAATESMDGDQRIAAPAPSSSMNRARGPDEG